MGKGFFSSLLAKDDSELVIEFIQENELSVPQIKELLLSIHAKAYIDMLKKERDLENASSVISVPDIYFQEVGEVLNLPPSDKASDAVRNILASAMRSLRRNDIFIVGQLVERGVSGLCKILQSQEAVNVICKNLHRLYGVEISSPEPGISEVLKKSVAEYTKIKEAKELDNESEAFKLNRERMLLTPIEELEFFNGRGDVYASLGRRSKNQITRLRKELLCEGFVSLNDVLLLDEGMFCLVFKPDRWTALQECLIKSGLKS